VWTVWFVYCKFDDLMFANHLCMTVCCSCAGNVLLLLLSRHSYIRAIRELSSLWFCKLLMQPVMCMIRLTLSLVLVSCAVDTCRTDVSTVQVYGNCHEAVICHDSSYLRHSASV
jgi:hypothetical protein